MSARLLALFGPTVFVLLWSTGFIGARYAAPYAEPMTTLAMRFIGAITVLSLWALIARAKWPKGGTALHCLGIGVLLHAFYLGGVFIAVDLGLPAGPAALIVSLQPVLTGLVMAAMAAERISLLRWLGIALGFSGVVLVTLPKLSGPEGWPAAGIGFCIASLISITIASTWQKRLGGGIDLRTGAALQYIGGALVLIPAAALFETQTIDWTPQLVFALFWMVVVLSIGAIGLYFLLLARGSLVATTSLMYLVPAVTAVMAWFMFDETLIPLQLGGLALSTLGVALVTRAPKKPPAPI